MITVNAMGDACPIPVIKTKKALEERGAQEEVEVLVDNETAVRNVTKMAESFGASVTCEKKGEAEYRLTIGAVQTAGSTDGSSSVNGVSGGQEKAESGLEDICGQDNRARGNTVVAVSSDQMGDGDAKLGRILMKSFIFALTQLDCLPETILFYNGGAKLTVEGSESLEDLKKMEEQGTAILTCGTCLDFYGIKDKLAVGTVTNMYSIVETMQKAGNIIRP